MLGQGKESRYEMMAIGFKIFSGIWLMKGSLQQISLFQQAENSIELVFSNTIVTH